MALRAFGLNCTLKAGPATSSTQKLLDQVLQAMAGHGVETSYERVVDFDVKPGVKADEGNGDQWPTLPQKVKDLDKTPPKLAATIKTIASNAVHLARLLQDNPYPPPSQKG